MDETTSGQNTCIASLYNEGAKCTQYRVEVYTDLVKSISVDGNMAFPGFPSVRGKLSRFPHISGQFPPE